jgi:hypothetical protein
LTASRGRHLASSTCPAAVSAYWSRAMRYAARSRSARPGPPRCASANASRISHTRGPSFEVAHSGAPSP